MEFHLLDIPIISATKPEQAGHRNHLLQEILLLLVKATLPYQMHQVRR